MIKKSIGIVGLGKMGKNIAFRLLEKGYSVTAFNRSKEPMEEVAKKGAKTASSFQELVKKLAGKKVVWLMLPAGEATDHAVCELAKHMGKGDILIDGANSRYIDSMRHSELLKKKGILYLDAGCSGGPSGALSGMCIMVGGEWAAFEECETLFKDLSVKKGYIYTGGAGSGHFVKMVHNAIEYGIMQSIAEGVDLLSGGPYKDLELAKIARLWDNGSVIRGYLMELTARALEKDPKLDMVKPYVEDTGEGRWSVQAAVEYGIPFTGISNSLYERFSSRNERQLSRRLLAALRHEFGGHKVKKE
jgi:6-phosphogluconate dehydrogenase